MGGVCGVGQRDLPGVVRGAHQVRDGQVQGALGQVGQGGGHGGLTPHASHVGDGRGQCDPALGQAQGGRHLGARRGEGDGGQAGHRVRGHLAGTGLQHQRQHVRLPQQQVGQVGAAAAQGCQGRRAVWRPGQRGLVRAERGVAFGQPLRCPGVAGVRP